MKTILIPILSGAVRALTASCRSIASSTAVRSGSPVTIRSARVVMLHLPVWSPTAPKWCCPAITPSCSPHCSPTCSIHADLYGAAPAHPKTAHNSKGERHDQPH